MKYSFTKTSDYTFKYEELARSAFNCEKSDDPWAYAKQERYDGLIVKLNLESKKALSLILSLFILRHKDAKNIDKLISLEKKVWSLETPQQVNKLIDDTMTFLERLNKDV